MADKLSDTGRTQVRNFAQGYYEDSMAGREPRKSTFTDPAEQAYLAALLSVIISAGLGGDPTKDKYEMTGEKAAGMAKGENKKKTLFGKKTVVGYPEVKRGPVMGWRGLPGDRGTGGYGI